MPWGDVFSTVLSTIGALGGAALIVFGLAAWLGRVWAGRILETDRAKYAGDLEALKTRYLHETERLRSDLEKTVHVSRVHFETEFKAMAEIWRAVADVRASISDLRPIGLHLGTKDEDPDAALNLKFKKYAEQLSTLLQVVHYNSPFYPKDLYGELVELTKTANAEYTNLALGDVTKDGSWYKQGLQNREAVMASAERVSDLIRSRVESLSIIGG